LGWPLEELIECWTLDKEELALLANKSGATRLGFGLMLKFFELPPVVQCCSSVLAVLRMPSTGR
jgi:hypothetical protein